MYKPFDSQGTNKSHVYLELLVCDEHIFEENLCKLLSDGDYLTAKVWGPLLETLFRGTGIILHWKDTVSENVKATARSIKLDLRATCDENKFWKRNSWSWKGWVVAKEIQRSKIWTKWSKASQTHIEVHHQFIPLLSLWINWKQQCTPMQLVHMMVVYIFEQSYCYVFSRNPSWSQKWRYRQDGRNIKPCEVNKHQHLFETNNDWFKLFLFIETRDRC